MSSGTANSSLLHNAEPTLPRFPPLQTGDRLTSDEFERCYHAMPHQFKAELIEGIVYVLPQPFANPNYSLSRFRLIGWLGTYEANTPGTAGGDNGTIRLDLDNEPQPLTFLRILPSFGGQTRDTEDKYIEGAPELIAEIAGSSVNYDLHEKLNAYRRNGVREYIVWRTWDRELDWFKLQQGQFVKQSPDEQGWIKSSVFPGLWLDVKSLLAGESKQVLAVLQQGINSAEHEQFVVKLEQQRKQ